MYTYVCNVTSAAKVLFEKDLLPRQECTFCGYAETLLRLFANDSCCSCYMLIWKFDVRRFFVSLEARQAPLADGQFSSEKQKQASPVVLQSRNSIALELIQKILLK